MFLELFGVEISSIYLLLYLYEYILPGVLVDTSYTVFCAFLFFSFLLRVYVLGVTLELMLDLGDHFEVELKFTDYFLALETLWMVLQGL